MQDTGCRIQDAGCGVQVAGFWILDAGGWRLEVGFLAFDTRNRLPGIDFLFRMVAVDWVK